MSSPAARLTVITLGVADMRRSIAFYSALGLQRRMQATGEDVAFFNAGPVVVALYSWDKLAEDAALDAAPRPTAFRGTTLAWNCSSVEEVDEAFEFALSVGATVLKRPHETFFGGYSGYFADPDGYPWEVVQAPGIEVQPDGRVVLPD
ncbi:MAG TPA: VOC family protein [Xanthobacteraceae bacterium]|nr:VOC family protein [Xanthobacteraceae bacterium]